MWLNDLHMFCPTLLIELSIEKFEAQLAFSSGNAPHEILQGNGKLLDQSRLDKAV